MPSIAQRKGGVRSLVKIFGSRLAPTIKSQRPFAPKQLLNTDFSRDKLLRNDAMTRKNGRAGIFLKKSFNGGIEVADMAEFDFRRSLFKFWSDNF